jgi:HK97 family phage portal protein
MSGSNGWTSTLDAALTPPPSERSIAGEEIFFPSVAGSAGVMVTERSALQLPAMLSVLNVLATDVAVMPLNVYRKRKSGGRDHVWDDPREDLLNVNPDGQEEGTAVCFRSAWMLHALQSGNGYAEIVRKGAMPAGLLILDPDTTKAKRIDGTLRYQLDNKKFLPSANVLHLAGLSYDGLTGLNFTRLLRQAIGVGMAEESFTADYFANGTEPGGTIEVPQKLEQPGADRLRDRFEMKHRGVGNRHRVAVLEQGAKFVPSSADPEKSQLVEARKYQLLDICRPWRIPPHKAGDYSQAHLANIEASNLDYIMTALMYWLVGIEQQCLLKLFTRAERMAGFFVEHNVLALLRGDIKTRFESYGLALDKGWLNRDEVRQRENINPIGEEGGGEKFLVQLNQTTLELIGENESEEPPDVAAAEQVEGEAADSADEADASENEAGEPEGEAGDDGAP